MYLRLKRDNKNLNLYFNKVNVELESALKKMLSEREQRELKKKSHCKNCDNNGNSMLDIERCFDCDCGANNG